MYRCCLWWRDSPLICVMETYDVLSTSSFLFHTFCVQLWCHMTYSHAQLSVVQEILHRVHAGELVEDLWPIGDHTCRGVYRSDAARDVDKLDIWEVRKRSTSNLVIYLLIREACITRKSVCRFLSWGRNIKPPTTKGYQTYTILINNSVNWHCENWGKSIVKSTSKLFLQDEMELSFMANLNFNTGGSTFQSAVPKHSGLLNSLFRTIRVSL